MMGQYRLLCLSETRTCFYNSPIPEYRGLMSTNTCKEVAETQSCPRSPESLSVERVAEAKLPTEWGEFRIAGYRSLESKEEFVVLYKGDLRPEIPTLVRIHSQCLTGDVFASTKCDCGPQLHRTMQMIEEAGLEIVERVSIQVPAQEPASKYLQTKREKLGHLLEV